MIAHNLAKNILTIGPQYTEKGGIASVVKSYRPMFAQFNFIASYVSGNIIKKMLNLFQSIVTLVYWCLFKNVEIIHIHTASNTDFRRSSIYVYISKLFHKKVILHIHGGKFEEFYFNNRTIVKKTCSRCLALVTVSNYFVKFIKDANLHNNIFLIPNCIKEPSVNSISQKNLKNITLLYMGRIDDNKGIFNLLEVFKTNKYDFDGKIILNIAGSGEINRLNKFIEDNDMLDLVKFHGWANENKKKELLSNSDIYIQLSEFESFGISILEAMSYGLPVITTGVGGVPDLVVNMKNGIIVQRNNYASIFNAIMFFFENESDRIKFGAESKRMSEQYFPQKIEEKLNKIYNEILNDKLK